MKSENVVALASVQPLTEKPALIFGAGQVAQVFQEYLSENGYRTAAYVVDSESEYQPFGPLNRPLVSMDEVVAQRAPEEYCFIIGMSFKGLNAPRAEKYAAMLDKGYEPLTFVDRRARVSPSAKIGAGSFIMEGNVIQTGVEIGVNTVLWAGNHVGHHSRIGDHVWISSHAVISGAVKIGCKSFVGVNATIRDGVKVGAQCVIGAAANIDADCEEFGVYKAPATERHRVPSNRLRGI